jgi:hypothetical protein
VPVLVDEASVADFTNLVDSVAELEAAILGVHGRLRVRPIAAVDVHRPCHAAPRLDPAAVPSACALLARALIRADAQRPQFAM